MSYQAKVYRTQGASALVIDAGGSLNAASGSLTLPTNLRRGMIPLNLFTARSLSSGEAFNSFNVSATGAALPTGSVGGLLGAGTIPALAMNSTVNQAAYLNWASGQNQAIAFTPIAIPPDFDASGALTIHAFGERASDNASDNKIDFRFWNGSQTTDAGSSGATMTTAPAEYSVTITTGHLSAHPGYWNVQIAPTAHNNNAVRVYNAWIEYQRTSS